MKGRIADCDVPPAPNPGGGPAPHYAKGGRAQKYVLSEGEKSWRRLDRPGRKRGGKLTAAERHALPGKDFALPGERYPINDENHGRNALARVSQHGTPEEKATVRAAVHRKFPDIKESKE